MASNIKTLKEDNGDIVYPQTLTGAVYTSNNTALDTELAKYVTAEDIATTATSFGTITTGMISDGAVTNPKLSNDAVNTTNIVNNSITSNKIDWTSITKPYYEPGDVVTISGDPANILSGVTLANVRESNWFLPLPKSLEKVNGVTVELTGSQNGYYYFSFGTNSQARPVVNTPVSGHLRVNGVIFPMATTSNSPNMPTYSTVVGQFGNIKLTFS